MRPTGRARAAPSARAARLTAFDARTRPCLDAIDHDRGRRDETDGPGPARLLAARPDRSPPAGGDWPTAQEAVLKLREGAWISAGAHHTEQLLHGHLAAVDERVRAYVLEGEGRAAERAHDAAAALRELGCETTLVPTRHPVLD